jgi:transposase
MKRVFDESFKKIAIELSYLKGSVLEASKELDMEVSRLSK